MLFGRKKIRELEKRIIALEQKLYVFELGTEKEKAQLKASTPENNKAQQFRFQDHEELRAFADIPSQNVSSQVQSWINELLQGDIKVNIASIEMAKVVLLKAKPTRRTTVLKLSQIGLEDIERQIFRKSQLVEIFLSILNKNEPCFIRYAEQLGRVPTYALKDMLLFIIDHFSPHQLSNELTEDDLIQWPPLEVEGPYGFLLNVDPLMGAAILMRLEDLRGRVVEANNDRLKIAKYVLQGALPQSKKLSRLMEQSTFRKQSDFRDSHKLARFACSLLGQETGSCKVTLSKLSSIDLIKLIELIIGSVSADQ